MSNEGLPDWIRVYLDREKISSLLHHYLKKSELGVRGWLKGPKSTKFDLDLLFAKLPVTRIVPDEDLDGVIDKIFVSEKPHQVREILDQIVGGDQSKGDFSTGRLIVAEAREELVETVSLIRPDGSRRPLLTKGSYLAYRSPFEKLILSDGVYHSALLFQPVQAAVGEWDWLKILIKEYPEIDVNLLLQNWDTYHARVIGILGPCTPYNCRVRRTDNKYDVIKTSYGLYTLCVDVSPPEDMELVERIRDTWGKG